MSAAIFLLRPLPTILVALYFFFFLRRAANFWGAPTEKFRVKLLVALAALALGTLMLFLHSVVTLFVLLVLLFGLIMDAIHLVLHTPLRRTRWSGVWRCGLVPVIISAFFVCFGFFHMRNVQKTVYQLTSDRISAPTRILFVSDLHFGNAMDEARLSEYCAQMQEAKPDLVILGGDIVDESSEKEEMEQAFAALGGIKSTYGVFYVYGNHDRSNYRGDKTYSMEDLNAAITQNGITILRNEAAELGVLTLIGRNDRSSGNRPSAQELTSAYDSSEFLLLVDHQPVEAEENAAAGIDLMLSGHTHNGQIWPIGYINALIGPKYGQYRFDRMQLIVSSGICGWGFPVRTQGISEYVLIDLLPAE